MGYDVPITAGVVTDGIRAGFADIQNQASKMRADVQRTFSQAIAFSGLTAAISEAINLADRVQDLGERFGVDTHLLLQWSNAGEKVGTSMEGIAAGYNKLEIARSKALSGDAAMIEHFRNLNVTLEDLRNLSPDQLMLKIGNSSMEAAELVAVLGRNALELRPLLAGLADGSIQLGDAMSSNTIKALDNVSDALKKIRQDLTNTAGTWLAFSGEWWQRGWYSIGMLAVAGKDLIVAQFEAIKKAMHFDFSGAGRELKSAFDLALAEIKEAYKQEGFEGIGSAGAPAARDEARRFGGEDESTPASRASSSPSSRSSGAASEARELEKVESLRARLNKLNEEAARRQSTLEEKSAALQREKNTLLEEYIARNAQGQSSEADYYQTAIAMAEKQKEIDGVSAAIAKERAATEKETAREREKAAEQAERARQAAERAQGLAQKELETVDRQNQLLILTANGHADIAERLKIEWEYEDKINEAIKAANEARAAGNEELAKTNEALAQQLATQKELVLAANAADAAEKEAAVNRERWASGMQRFVDNATDAVDQVVNSEGFRKLAEKIGAGAAFAMHFPTSNWAMAMATDPNTGKVDINQLRFYQAVYDEKTNGGRNNLGWRDQLMADQRAQQAAENQARRAREQSALDQVEADKQRRAFNDLVIRSGGAYFGQPLTQEEIDRMGLRGFVTPTKKPGGAAGAAGAGSSLGRFGGGGGGSGTSGTPAPGPQNTPPVGPPAPPGSDGAAPLHPRLENWLSQIFGQLKSTHTTIKGPPGTFTGGG